jgi:hypothetical protein
VSLSRISQLHMQATTTYVLYKLIKVQHLSLAPSSTITSWQKMKPITMLLKPRLDSLNQRQLFNRKLNQKKPQRRSFLFSPLQRHLTSSRPLSSQHQPMDLKPCFQLVSPGLLRGLPLSTETLIRPCHEKRHSLPALSCVGYLLSPFFPRAP